MGIEQTRGSTRYARWWRPRSFLRFRRDENGSTVVEFAMLALPFMLLLFAILETCISFAAGQLMANATDDLARQIRTGQIKGDELTETRVHDFICSRMEMMVASGCSNLVIDLRTEDSFEELAKIPMPLSGTGDTRVIDEGKKDFKKGTSMQKSMLRVLYPWPIMTNLMQKSLSTLQGGKILLFSTATWQNEPFDD